MTNAQEKTDAVPGLARRPAAIPLAGAMAALTIAVILTACSREKIDWKSAEAADTVESYDHFLQRHPDSDLATQARARVAQLNEDRAWKTATVTDTPQAYQQFLAQYGQGKWAEEARIRIENFALDGTATGPARPPFQNDPASGTASAGTPPPPSGPPASTNEGRPASANTTAAATRSSAVGGAEDTARVNPSGGVQVEPAAEPAPPVPKPGSEGQFGVQLGAFRTQEAALNHWKRIQVKYDTDLHGLFARAVPVHHSAGTLYRLQAPVGAEAKARGICASLTRQSQPCVVVLPPPR